MPKSDYLTSLLPPPLDEHVPNVSASAVRNSLPQAIRRALRLVSTEGHSYLTWLEIGALRMQDVWFARVDRAEGPVHVQRLGLGRGMASDPEIAVSGARVTVTWLEQRSVMIAISEDGGASFTNLEVGEIAGEEEAPRTLESRHQ